MRIAIPKQFQLTQIPVAVNLRGGENVASDASMAVQKLYNWRFFVAGGLSAALSHSITCPIDVVKTRIQSYPLLYNQGVLPAAIKIAKEEGITSLLLGIGPTFVGYGLEGALKFGMYEVFKSCLYSFVRNETTVLILASVMAGFMASLVLCPIEVTRIKMVSDPEYRNSNLRQVSKKDFVASFNGLVPMMMKQIPYTIAKQVTFDIVTASFHAMYESEQSKSQLQSLLSDSQMKFIITFLSAIISATAAAFFSHPGDMILTVLFLDKRDNRTVDVIREIYHYHLLKGFFIGMRARLYHVVCIITLQLIVYDYIKQSLGLPRTGCH